MKRKNRMPVAGRPGILPGRNLQIAKTLTPGNVPGLRFDGPVSSEFFCHRGFFQSTSGSLLNVPAA